MAHRMTASLFTTLFVVFLLMASLSKLILMGRQIRHVERHRQAVPEAFTQTISLDAHQRAADYTVARARLGMIDIVVTAVYTLLLTLGGVLQNIHDLVSHVFTAGGIAHGVTLLGCVALLGWLVDLPFSLWRTFHIEKEFGFNRMTPRLYLADTVKSTLVAVLIGLPLLAAVLWLMSATGRFWWVWVWAVWLAFNVLAMLIWPTFIAPLFNRFTPLEDGELKTRVEALLARCGFRAQGLYVMDGSRRSAHGNAYFTGFGASRRIVFFDTLLEKLSPEEVEAVLAHELGHFRRRHILKRMLLLAPLSLALLALLGWLMGQSWFYTGLGMTAAGTATTLALFFIALPVFTFFFTPLMSLWSRKHEFEADDYAAAQTRASDLIDALVRLYRDNAATLTPDPLYSACFDSHPPAAVRIAHLAGKA